MLGGNELAAPHRPDEDAELASTVGDHIHISYDWVKHPAFQTRKAAEGLAERKPYTQYAKNLLISNLIPLGLHTQ